MKKVLSLILCAVMLASALAGCSTLEKTDTGIVIMLIDEKKAMDRSAELVLEMQKL